MANGTEEFESSNFITPELLDEDLEELDVTEYEIPHVENPPTLESILCESDDDSMSEYEATSTMPELFQEQGDSASITSTSSLDSKGRKTDKKTKRNLYSSYDLILQHVILRGISSQLVSAAERVNGGTPTAMTVSFMIAVGTSHGLVLVFDVKQVLKLCLGGTVFGEEFGSVSSLSFNTDCTRLLCGFAKGQITMWDITTGKLLRTITDAHPPGTAVLHVKFTDDPTLAICSDSGGSVFELNFKRVMTVRGCDSKCIFSGSHGEVLAIEPLHMIFLKDHALQDICLVALVTLSKVMVISIRSTKRIHFVHNLKANPATLPIICWQFVVIQTSQNRRVIDPVLTFGRENSLYFYQVVSTSQQRIAFLPLQTVELPYLLLNFAWLNMRTLITLDTTEHLHVIDVRTQEELEVLDLAAVQLVYGSSHFKGLATGGNVSKALALAGERACYQSIATYNGQLLLLGIKSVHVMTLRSWHERIDHLERHQHFTEALALALSFYEDRGKAVVGISSKHGVKRALIINKLVDVMTKFVNHAMLHIPERGRPETLEEYFLDIIPIVIEYCIKLHSEDLLFGEYFDAFSLDSIGKAVFLDSLEPHILNDAIFDIPPFIAKEFVNHYLSKNLLKELEACIVHLNVSILDLHQVITLCWNHNLYDALLYVYTQGMSDYTTPFQDMMCKLQQGTLSPSSLKDDQIRLGNKMLVYINFCLAGRAYPHGLIPEDKRMMVKSEIFRIMTLLHSMNASDDEQPYPCLRTLLHFDTRELLNVLSLAFEEPEFKRDTGILQRQRLVDILLQIMVDGEGFSPSQVGALFTFLARQMAKHDNTIMVNRMLFEQVLEYLTNPGEQGSRHEEKQQALLELLLAGGLQHYNEDRLLQLCEKAEFYQICELIYENSMQYEKIISCYLRDKPRQHDTFLYIEKVFSDTNLSAQDKLKVEREVFNHLEDLLQIDNRRTAQFLFRCFPLRVPEAVSILEGDAKNQFCLLEGLMDFVTNCSQSGFSSYDIGQSLQEKYISLMCYFEPSRVSGYLRSCDSYKIEETLEIVREYNIPDAMSFLLEKIGDIHGAFAIIYEGLQEEIYALCDGLASKQTITELDEVSLWVPLQRSLDFSIDFCQRNSHKLSEAERERLWFPLLESLMSPLQKHKRVFTPETQSVFKQHIHRLLNSMMGNIKLPTIVQKIIQDPSYQMSKIGEIKELILGMLETYNYEKTLLTATTNLLNADLYKELALLQSIAKKGLSSWSNVCGICTNAIHCSYKDEDILIFRCGHSYHLGCLKSVHQTNQPQSSSSSNSCPQICMKCERASRSSPSSIKDWLVAQRIQLSKHETSSSPQSKAVLNPLQIENLERLRKALSAPSYITVLADLKKKLPLDSTRPLQAITPLPGTSKSDFSLHLAPATKHTSIVGDY